ncbi:arsenate reductase (glutaredoxin) [Myroides guanonis]|uniref:Arsenate reductase n=1 Tax=Myroides guanonis TaxID=1150112 RepID=A0A1I3P9B3_9FLAO|nr:arsenate reductase (glutaredoxin) [Myroides guanonis]SFJ18022.1 arsenate reductase [Myroides guanonis]
MITIYHNPRCSKSREGLTYLEDKGVQYKITKYLDEPLTKEELTDILRKLNFKPIELVRTKEEIWKELTKDKNLEDNEIIEAMVKYPRLIERPIIINGDKAVIARPTENIDTII